MKEMKNKEILKKVIYKAEENGCTRCLSGFLDYHDENDITNYNKHYQIIFSHEFAKAFWGEKKVIEAGSGFNQWHGVTSLGAYSDWQVHLQRMVLEKEPLKYLEKFLKD